MTARIRGTLLLLAPLLAAAAIAGARTAAAAQGGASFDCPALYESGSYVQAAECFESLLRQGHVGGHLLYDLGNARYRAGDLGQAILAWRRARLFLPRDGDVRANLESAREQVRDDLPPPGTRQGLARPLLAPFDALSSGELLLLGSIAWALLFVVLSIRLRRPFVGWAALAATLAVLATAGLGGRLVRSYWLARHPVAVVLADDVTLRSGRDVMSTDLARLHEGAEAIVIEESGDRVQVALSTGPRGWLPVGSVGLVREDER